MCGLPRVCPRVDTFHAGLDFPHKVLPVGIREVLA